jgi:hypothetical protein
MEKIEYKERPLARKDDSLCKPLTLLVRKYYHNKVEYYQRNKEELKLKARQRYAKDKAQGTLRKQTTNKKTNDLKMNISKTDSIDVMQT